MVLGRTVLTQIPREALVLMSIGVALGLGASALPQSAITSLLSGISAMDPINLAVVIARLAAVAALASLVYLRPRASIYWWRSVRVRNEARSSNPVWDRPDLSL
jgi:hypothetical protein